MKVITSAAGHRVDKAVVQFPYRGYVISLTTLFGHPETAVIRDSDGAFLTTSYGASVENIVKARDFIDAISGPTE